MDFIRELAFPLPATVIAVLMGAPAEDIEPIKTWSDRLAAYLGGAVDERDNFAEASAGVAALVDYFRALLRERERRPRDDLMSLMLARRARGRAPDARRGGRELRPAALRRPRDDDQPARQRPLPSAPPSRRRRRSARRSRAPARRRRGAAALRRPRAGHDEDRDRGRRRGTAGRFAAATWSCRSWRRPTATRASSPIPTRSTCAAQPERHLAFACGIHFCLGAWLARLEARVVLDTVLRAPARAGARAGRAALEADDLPARARVAAARAGTPTGGATHEGGRDARRPAAARDRGDRDRHARAARGAGAHRRDRRLPQRSARPRGRAAEPAARSCSGTSPRASSRRWARRCATSRPATT